FQRYPKHYHLHSFPTRRSSDLEDPGRLCQLTSKVSAVFSDEVIDMKKTQVIDLNQSIRRAAALAKSHTQPHRIQLDLKLSAKSPDRKSTRLNSSHDQISYAVFC